MATGKPPFTDKDRNIEQIEKLIIENNPIYPNFMSEKMKSLINLLL